MPLALTQDPDLRIRGRADAAIRPVGQHGGKYVFAVPAGAAGLRLLARAARPDDTVGPFIDDRRSLGVLVGEITPQDGRRNQTPRTHLTAKTLSG